MRLVKRLRRSPYRLGLDYGLAKRGQQGPQVVTVGLLTWWKHDEGTGTTLHDYHGGNDGVINGANFWNNTSPDGSPVGTYDGTNNYVDGIGNGLALASGITIVAAINTATVAAGTQDRVIAKRNCNPAANTGNYCLMRLGSDIAGGEKQLFFGYTQGKNNWNYFKSVDVLTVNTWRIFCVAGTFGASSSFTLYNGMSPVTISWTGGDGVPGAAEADDYVQVGSADNIGDDSGHGRPWQGKLGDILLYSRALSYNEVVQNFGALRGRYDL